MSINPPQKKELFRGAGGLEVRVARRWGGALLAGKMEGARCSSRTRDYALAEGWVLARTNDKGARTKAGWLGHVEQGELGR